MEENLNVTYITFGGHIEVDKYRYLYFMVVLILYILIICSNSTIVYLIWKHRDLHEPMYIFIAALLLNSVLLSTTVYPKLLIDFLSEQQIISHQACLAQFYMIYTFSYSEFDLLAAMAYDRYVSICKPLQYPTLMRKRTVCVILALSWLVPACEVVRSTVLSANTKICTFTLKVIFCNNSIFKLFCATSRAVVINGIVVVLNTVVLPVFFIIFSYTRIFIICYHSSGEVRRKAAQTCLPHLIVLFNYFYLISFDFITARIETDIPKAARVLMTLQLVVYNPLFNPIIYGLKMKEIYKHLKKLFCR